MVNQTVQKVEDIAKTEGNKALAWLRTHWYSFLIGGGAVEAVRFLTTGNFWQ